MRLDGPNEELIDQIVRLSIRYGIVTPYTSYLVTEDAPFGEEALQRIVDDAAEYAATTIAPTTGEAAVSQADAEGNLAGSDLAAVLGGDYQGLVRTAGSRAFRLADGIWTDTAYDPAGGTIAVPFLSGDYFALAAVHPDLAAALGGRAGHRRVAGRGLRGGGRRRDRRGLRGAPRHHDHCRRGGHRHLGGGPGRRRRGRRRPVRRGHRRHRRRGPGRPGRDCPAGAPPPILRRGLSNEAGAAGPRPERRAAPATVAGSAHPERSMSERIGFIGLGTMGGGMARNLLAKGHPVTVWNRSPRRVADLVAGAIAAAGPADLAARCDIVMVCVSDTPDVEQVALGPGGLREGLSPGALVIDHSTISPRATRALAAAVAERGAHWLDAPVSGGSEGAARGTLSIMVGGDPSATGAGRAPTWRPTAPRSPTSAPPAPGRWPSW